MTLSKTRERNAALTGAGEKMEIINQLRRPFPPEEVHYKIQTVGAKSCLCVAYVDARNVAERLNFVIDDGEWSTHYETVTLEGISGVICELTIPGLGTRSDIGSFDNVNADAHGLKAVYSDAFKRAGVHFGIAVSLYSHPTSFLSKDSKGIRKNSQGKPAGITDDGQDELRQTYRDWLAEEGKEAFGEVM